MKYLNRNKKFEFVKNDLFGTHNCLDENEETLFEAEEVLHKINDYLRKRGIVYSNFITSNKPQEYEISIIFNLKKNKNLQGFDAKSKNGNLIYEIKNINPNTKNKKVGFSFPPPKDENDEPYERSEGFEKLEEIALEPNKGKLSGKILIGVRSKHFYGFEKIYEIEAKEFWFEYLRERIKNSYKGGNAAEARHSVSLYRIEKLINTKKVSGKIYCKSEIDDLIKNLPIERKDELDELAKLFEEFRNISSKVWTVDDSNEDELDFVQGIDPFLSNKYNEFKESVMVRALPRYSKTGPDGRNEFGDYIEFKDVVISPNGTAKGARVDWKPNMNDKNFKKFYRESVTPKFIWNGESVVYYIFERLGNEFVNCVQEYGDKILRDYKDSLKKSWDTRKKRATSKVYVAISPKKYKSANIPGI